MGGDKVSDSITSKSECMIREELNGGRSGGGIKRVKLKSHAVKLILI